MSTQKSIVNVYFVTCHTQIQDINSKLEIVYLLTHPFFRFASLRKGIELSVW